MCFRPITINNPALVKNNVYNKSRLEVPCGHCSQCKDIKRLSWFVRLYYEWKKCEELNGFGLFETFTYNEKHVPRILPNYKGGLRCFSVRDLQLYLKRLRKRLSKEYPDLNLTNVLKYFISMEYGGNTHRPHYHPVFFVESPLIDRFKFKKICEELWNENGFTRSGDLNFGFICNAGGLSYVAKYVCKDAYEDSFVRNREHYLLKLGYTKDQFKSIYPRVLCSKNLGINALEYDLNNDFNTFLEGSIVIPDKDKILRNYKLPLYYERKLFYDTRFRYFDGCSYVSVARLSEVPFGVDYSPIYVLNDLGLEMKDVRAKKTLDAVTNVYRIVTSLPSFDDFITKLNNKFDTKFKNMYDFQIYVKNNLPEHIFVNYSLVYRGCKTVEYKLQSPCGSTPYYDYMLINNMSRGYRPLSVDYDNLCYNIDLYNNIPFIDDIYCMVRYMFFLVNTELEELNIKKELNYVKQKSAYIAQIEHIV